MREVRRLFGVWHDWCGGGGGGGGVAMINNFLLEPCQFPTTETVPEVTKISRLLLTNICCAVVRRDWIKKAVAAPCLSFCPSVCGNWRAAEMFLVTFYTADPRWLLLPQSYCNWIRTETIDTSLEYLLFFGGHLECNWVSGCGTEKCLKQELYRQRKAFYVQHSLCVVCCGLWDTQSNKHYHILQSGHCAAKSVTCVPDCAATSRLKSQSASC